MNNNSLEVGDIIRIDRFGYKHVGVYVGSRWFSFGVGDVVHNRKGGGVELTSLAQFSDGCDVFIHQKATGDHFQRQLIAQRAMQLIGTKYDLLTFNCEHAANLAQQGSAKSPQIAEAAVLGFIVCGIAALSALSAKRA